MYTWKHSGNNHKMHQPNIYWNKKLFRNEGKKNWTENFKTDTAQEKTKEPFSLMKPVSLMFYLRKDIQSKIYN